MPYSQEMEKKLSEKSIKPGDRISVIKSGQVYEGVLLPRMDSGNQSDIILKLDNGYNIGIDFSGCRIEKSGTSEKDIGKTKESFLKIKFDTKKPKVTMLTTGGTIISKVDYRTGGVYAVDDPREMLYSVPELAETANIKIIPVMKKMSEDMCPDDWIEIAKAAARELNTDAKGIVITHGTDTMHYTAAALSFFLKGLSKPVVLTGAQKSGDRGSSDSFINLICSTHLAISDIAEVGICMHGSTSDDYCLFSRGTKVRKMDTVRRDAFRPINDLPLAKVWPDGRVEKSGSCKKRFEGQVAVDAAFENKTALIKVYPGADPEIIEHYVNRGYKGFVIEGTGLGHVPTVSKKSWTNKIKEYSRGIPFVITSQTIYGRVNTDVYTNLRVLFHGSGAISGQDMIAETAYVKLGHILAKTTTMENVRKLMLTNMTGEITERTLPETFLQ